MYPPSELPSAIEPLLSALKENLSFPPTDLGEMKTLVRRLYKRRAAASDSDDSDADSDGSAAGVRPKRKRRRRGSDEPRPPKRKAQEVQSYKSAAFIWDSDEDEEADAAFFAREAALRAEMGRHGQEAEEEIRAIMEGKRRPRPNLNSPSATPAADHAMDVDEAEEEVDEETLQKRAEWKLLRKAIMAEWLEHDDDEWRPSDHQEWTGPYTEADDEEFLFRKAGNWDSDAEGPIDPINSDSDSEDEAPRVSRASRAPTSRASTAPRRAESTPQPDSDAEYNDAADNGGRQTSAADASDSEGDKENRPPMRAKLAALAEAAHVPMKNVEDEAAPVARRRRVVESDDED